MIKTLIKINLVLITLISFSFFASATYVEVFYPQNNTSTDMYYANNSGYYSNQTNYINTTDMSILIIKNQIVTNDSLLDDPKIIYRSMLPIFLIIVLVFVIVIITRIFKGVYK